MYQRTKLGIALGGGGARGIAHVGVLKVLERENIHPDFITGTSIGALVGAAYAVNPCAASLEKRILEVLSPQSPEKIPLQNLDRVNWQESSKPNWKGRVARYIQKEAFLLLTVFRNAVLSLDDLQVCVAAFLPDIDIPETAIPFAAVATDLNSGEPVVLDKGPIIPTVMASCAVPGFMPPVHLDGKILFFKPVDTGLTVFTKCSRRRINGHINNLRDNPVWKDPAGGKGGRTCWRLSEKTNSGRMMKSTSRGSRQINAKMNVSPRMRLSLSLPSAPGSIVNMLP